MKFKVLTEADYKTTKWSGGDTTQLYIYPENGSYKERDFLFRLSTATVNDEKSTFTKLEGVSRKLMVLSGEMKLEHNGRYSKVLKEFEQDSFMGYWDTTSCGKVVDFNLMIKGGCIGQLKHIEIMPDSEIILNLSCEESNSLLSAIYPIGQPVELLLCNKEILVEEKNLVIIELDKIDENDKITIFNKNKNMKANVVIVEVYMTN